MADEFWFLFVHVGPRLAANTATIKDDAGENTIIDHVDSAFLGKVEKEEMLNVVKKLCNQRIHCGYGCDMSQEYN